MSLLLDLLGVKFSRETRKWVPFDESMSVLGVILDLGGVLVMVRFLSGILMPDERNLTKH